MGATAGATVWGGATRMSPPLTPCKPARLHDPGGVLLRVHACRPALAAQAR